MQTGRNPIFRMRGAGRPCHRAEQTTVPAARPGMHAEKD